MNKNRRIQNLGTVLLILCCSFTSLVRAAVTINGRKIYVDGTEYFIRGICYDPIKKGDTRYAKQDFSQIATDISLMKQACINTIRTYYPITDKTVLDAFATAGIRIIMGFPSYDDRGGNAGPDMQTGSYKTYITTYKNHNAILMWCFGNEYNYHPEWFGNNVSNWYSALNTAAGQAHTLDPNHPTATAHGDLPTTSAISACPNVDVWGMNVYRGDNPSIVFTTWQGRSTKPMFLSESGADSWDTNNNKEDKTAQATANYNIAQKVLSYKTICSGICFFEFNDNWWKHTGGSPSVQETGGFSGGTPYDNYSNEEWYGMVDIYRNPKPVHATYKSLWCPLTVDESIQKDFSYSVFPNPSSKTKVNIAFSGKPTRTVEVKLYDILMNEVSSKQVSFPDDRNTLSLSFPDIPNGMYFLQLSSGRDKQVFKIIMTD